MTEPVENALRRLKDSAAAQKAPDQLELKLRQSFRVHHASRKRRLLWVPAALAASLLLASVLLELWWRPVDPPTVALKKESPRVAPQRPERLVEPVAQAAALRQASKRKAPAKRTPVRQLAAKPKSPPQEFIEIPYAPALTDYDSGRVVRVNMPGASVRSLGLPVMSDRVQADVLLGDDGIARAIRVVSNSGLN